MYNDWSIRYNQSNISIARYTFVSFQNACGQTQHTKTRRKSSSIPVFSYIVCGLNGDDCHVTCEISCSDWNGIGFCSSNVK